MFQQFGDFFIETIRSTHFISISIRMALALLCGGFIGFERGRKGRPAGLRTHILVCVGSTLAMVTNEYLHDKGLSLDASRMGAQVISGVGFLGAGTIMVTGRHKIKGLTTAASLWASACLGLAIGCGFYTAALIGAFAILIVNSVLHRLDVPIHSTSKISNVYIEFQDVKAIRKMITTLKAEEIKVSDLELIQPNESSKSPIGATLTLHSRAKVDHAEMFVLVESIDGVDFIEEI